MKSAQQEPAQSDDQLELFKVPERFKEEYREPPEDPVVSPKPFSWDWLVDWTWIYIRAIGFCVLLIPYVIFYLIGFLIVFGAPLVAAWFIVVGVLKILG